MGEQMMAVEFRNKTWFDAAHAASTLELERELGVAHVVVDSPQVGTANVVPPIWDITSTSLGILRLHGRNSATWNIKGATSASDRFDWDYSQAELEALVPRSAHSSSGSRCCKSSSTTTKRIRGSVMPGP